MRAATSQTRFRRRSRRRTLTQARRVDLAPACLAVGLIAGMGLLVGAPTALNLQAASGALLLLGAFALAASGPRQGHFGVLAAILTLFAVAMSSRPDSLAQAAPHYAVWAAAVAAWSVGFVSARQRLTDIAWPLLNWGWTLVTAWWLFGQPGVTGEAPLADWFPAPDPAAASVMFSLGALIGSARVLHTYKSAESEGLPLSETAERVLRDGLSGLLLLGFSISALWAVGNVTGQLATLSVLFAHAAWDLHATLPRERSRLRRALLRWAAPVAALGLALAAAAFAYLRDESIAAGAPGVAELPRIERTEIYFRAWQEKPLTGHGVGSIETVRDQAMTLDTYAALSPPGDAQNMILRQLVETGVFGVIAFLGLFVFACGLLTAGMRHMNGARTLPRLAVSTCGLLLLHGLLHSSLSLPGAIWTTTFLLGLAAGVLDLSATNRREA